MFLEISREIEGKKQQNKGQKYPSLEFISLE